MENNFEGRDYVPLQDPTTEIRLFRLNGGSREDAQCGTFSTHTLDEAPLFRAISSVDLETILVVDGKEWSVRHKYCCALWQVRLHYPYSWIWIDSVCVNQNDLPETSEQVTFMGDIYPWAPEVLAFIGIPESINYIDEALHEPQRPRKHEMSKERTRWPVPEETPAFVREELPWLLTNQIPRVWDDIMMYRPCRQWNEFCSRIYFSRVWAMQELAAGHDKIVCLCGEWTPSWHNPSVLKGEIHLFRTLSGPEQGFLGSDGFSTRPDTLVNTLSMPSSVPYMLTPVITGAGPVGSADPRDRVYSSLDLFDWSTSPLPGINVDCSRSRIDLALEVLACARGTAGEPEDRDAEIIAEALEITADEMLQYWQAKTKLLSKSQKSAVTRRKWRLSNRWAAEIFKHADGRLCVDLQQQRADSACEVEIAEPADPGLPQGDLSALQKLWSGDSVAAYATQPVAAGDVLISSRFLGAVVVRPVVDYVVSKRYRIVACAMIEPGFPVARPRERHNRWQYDGVHHSTHLPRRSDMDAMRVALSDAEALVAAVSNVAAPDQSAIDLQMVVQTIVAEKSSVDFEKYDPLHWRDSDHREHKRRKGSKNRKKNKQETSEKIRECAINDEYVWKTDLQ